MAHKSLLAIPAVLVAGTTNLPRGLHLELNATELERAASLVKQFEVEFREGNFANSGDIIHDITECDQVCSNWCWATSATMTASAFGSKGDCGANEAKVAGQVFGTSCDTSCSSTCNHGGTMTETCEGIEYLSGAKYKFTPNALQPADLESALQVGPIVAGVQWSLGGGHAITITGISGGNYVGHDPEGYEINVDYIGLLRYQPVYCKYPCSGQWMATSSTAGGPPAPTPAPVPPTPTPQPTPVPPTPTPQPTPVPPTPTPVPTPTPGGCHAISPVATDAWCTANCAGGYCPADLCKCDEVVV